MRETVARKRAADAAGLSSLDGLDRDRFIVKGVV
jgi:hypothetical protein